MEAETQTARELKAGNSPRELVIWRSAADFFHLERHAGQEMVLQIRGGCISRRLIRLVGCDFDPQYAVPLGLRSESYTNAADLPAITLLLLGTVLAAVAGRVVYQMALTATNNDNGFVSMFLLLGPAVTCLVSIPMSWWISELNIASDRHSSWIPFSCRAVICVFASILALGKRKTLMQRSAQLDRSAQ